MHPDHADFMYAQGAAPLSQREWKRIYSDGVRDAFQEGFSEGESHGIKEGHEDCVSAIETRAEDKSRIDELLKENKYIKERIKTAWEDGYESCEEDAFHKTKTMFEDSNFNEDNYDNN